MRWSTVVGFLILLFAQGTLHAQIEFGSFDFEGHTRDYIVFLPTNYDSTSNSPVVLNLHAYGDDAEGEMNFTGMNDVADTAGFIVVYPNAVDGIWNSGVSDNPCCPAPDVDDVGFIEVLIDTLNSHYGIDLERVYVCGMSNGGFMTHKLACQLSSRIAAVASVAGVISTSTAEECSLETTIPVLYIHGTADNNVPYDGGETGWYSAEETLGHWTSLNACTEADTLSLPDIDTTDGCTVERIRYTNCSDNSDVFFYKVINGGHTWPDAALYFPSFGNMNRDINANVEIWNFFRDRVLITVAAEEQTTLHPTSYALYQNYPNPFNPSTTIRFELPRSGHVTLKIFNLVGEGVATLISGQKDTGTHTIQWDATGQPSGVYFYRLKAGEFVETRKLVLLR